jgi:hypothetical protein
MNADKRGAILGEHAMRHSLHRAAVPVGVTALALAVLGAAGCSATGPESKPPGIAATAVNAPPPGNPANRLKFRHHVIDREIPGDLYGQTALVDVDKDGDLDFITGRSEGDLYWYEHRGPDDWVRHLLGQKSPSEVGAAALDVDGDGWIDLVCGGGWYRNSGAPREKPFERFVFDNVPKVHDVVLADLDGDGRPEVLTQSDRNNLRWYRVPKDPAQPWERHDIGPSVHAGLAVGDLDGDGDLDVVRSGSWFENKDGRGTVWVEHATIPFSIPSKSMPHSSRCVVVDIDRDGDRDLVMTAAEIKGAWATWVENLDGKGGAWKRHDLPPGDPAARGAYHSLAVADFDNDGDPDIFTCEMEWVGGDRPPRWFIWENVDGKGANFVERVILDANLGGHEAVVGDVDGDGDIDLCSKLWKPKPGNANGGKNHADFLENLLIERK